MIEYSKINCGSQPKGSWNTVKIPKKCSNIHRYFIKTHGITGKYVSSYIKIITTTYDTVYDRVSGTCMIIQSLPYMYDHTMLDRLS